MLSVKKQPKIKKSFNIHPYSIIFILIIIATVLTWIIPSGQFDRIMDEATGREIVVAGTYHVIEQTRIGFTDMLMCIQRGMVDSAEIVMFIFIIGGAFGVFASTGAIDVLMAKIITKFSGKTYSRFVFPILMLFFFSCAAIFGMGEEAMIFTPFIVATAIALGYDAITAVATLVLSIALGYSASLTNPFNIGIAQSIAGLPMFSGLWYRGIIFIVIYSIAAWYVLRYAKKIKKDPSKSLVADIDYSNLKISDDPRNLIMTNRHKLVLIVFGCCFAFMIFAIMKWAWWIDQLAALFLLVAFLVGIANRYTFGTIAEEFIKGAKTMLFAALMVAFARGIKEVLSSGMILDTVIYGLTIPLNNVPRLLVGPMMVLVQSVINLTIPSSSAMAVVTMPVMAPLADVLNVQRQTAIIAFQFGDGITNLLMPFYNVLIISLGLANVPFQRWFKWVLPLVGILLLVAFIMTGMAEFIQVGPF